MSEERIAEALRALAQHDRDLQAAPEMETLLIRGFRKQRARRRWRWIAVAGAAAACFVVAAFVTTSVTTRPSPQVSAPAVLPGTEAREVVTAPEPMIDAAPKGIRRARVIRRQYPRETVTDFFLWMDSAIPFDRGQLLRVELPAGVMRSVGLPVHEDHLEDLVQADVLVGEEGLPRAIRFVKSDMQ